MVGPPARLADSMTGWVLEQGKAPSKHMERLHSPIDLPLAGNEDDGPPTGTAIQKQGISTLERLLTLARHEQEASCRRAKEPTSSYIEHTNKGNGRVTNGL